MAPPDFLQAGIAAAQSGDRERAKVLLARAVQINPNAEQAWLWLGRVLTEPDRREYCFRRVLALNPDNLEARKQLGKTALSASFSSSKTDLHAESVPQPKPPESIGKPTPIPTPVPKTTSTISTDRPQQTFEHPQELPIVTDSGPSRLEKVMVAVIGMLLGLVICGLPLVYLVRSGNLDQFVPIALIPPTIPAPTPFPSETPVPTVTPSAIPTLTTQQVAQTTVADASQAEVLMAQGNCAEAIPLWDRVIARKPEYGDPYYKRAKCYLQLTQNQRSASEFQDYTRRALDDLDQAIAIGPVTGNYYLDRGDAYIDWAGLLPNRVDRDILHEIALENYRRAVAMGTDVELADTLVPVILFQLGRCNEGIAETKRLSKPTESGLNTLMALGNLCLGKPDQALPQIDTALKVNPNNYRKWLRAIILYNMGRLNDSLAQLNEIFETSPYYNGYRYYLRALIYYEQKKPDLAKADIGFGSGQTWSHEGLMSYVLGKIALDAGDREGGIMQIRYGEATLTREYGTLLGRIQRELTQLGAPPLSVTPSVKIAVTPIPTPKPTITALPTSAVTTPLPTPKGAVLVDLGIGTGKLIFQPNDYPAFHFQPATPLQIKTVQFLKFHLVSGNNVGATPLQLYLWNPASGGWGMVDLKWGENLLAFPERYVNVQGEIYAAIRNPSSQVVRVDNSGFTLGIQKPDGTNVVYGLK